MAFFNSRGLAKDSPRYRRAEAGENSTIRMSIGKRALLLAGASVAVAGLLACDSDDADQQRVSLEVTSDGFVGMPSQLNPGFARFVIEVEDGETSHGVVFLRAKDGVSADDLVLAAEGEEGPDMEKVAPAGGPTTIEPGASTTVVLELQPGLYSISHAPEGSLVNTKTFRVSGSKKGGAPSAEGVIGLGPGLNFRLPADFDGTGVFEVVNRDADLHEAAVIRLGEGATTEMLIEWARGGFNGPPPSFAFTGGFGPVEGGARGWFESDLEAGTYALICFIFNEDGPHFANGMLTEFTVE